MGSLCFRAAVGGLGLLIASTGLIAGEPPEAHAVSRRGVRVQGSLRTRLEGWRWFRGDTGDNSYIFSGNLFRLSFSQVYERVDWQVELALPFLLGLPENAAAAGAQGQLGLGAAYFAANGRSENAANLFPKQAYVRFRQGPQSVRLGRFEFLDGSEATPVDQTLAAVKRDRVVQRLIGNFTFTHVQRSVDGAQYLRATPNGTFTFVGGLPTEGVFQTNGWGRTETAFGYAAYTKPWEKKGVATETRLLGIYFQDWRGITKTDNRAAAARAADPGDIRIVTFGGHHLMAAKSPAGTVDFLAWGVGQAGRWGRLAHRSYATVVEAGVQPPVLTALRPWFRGGYTIGSGDGNPEDQVHGSFFQLLPTPRPFARFPFFNMQNNRAVMASMVLRPSRFLSVSAEFHSLRLANRNDLWYSGGGAYQASTFGYNGRAAGGARSLANLYDVSVELRPRPDLTVTVYSGYADGKAVPASLYPRGKNATFSFLECSYRF